ncbi:toxin-coregulated pilus transcriptional regulator TcpP [Aliivibrio fischeri]|uniref:toxin-coregulated pilus transcriptional regulator TcpP n=1 Tax=Aliivibrio fischeri TaxID=668 RepID=UPI00080EE3D1|nr:toxin-coregulated pilus transcriptional regulator TcpP [Aliivibrio fischeri]OCH39385.1 transcriptional regulator [Aliivibrio fischeri]
MVFKLNEIYWDPATKKLYDTLEDAVNGNNEYGSTTPLVSAILTLLIKEHPSICKNEHIKDVLWGTQWISNESIPQLIKRTRVSIKDTNRHVIENVKGNGYKINNVEEIRISSNSIQCTEKKTSHSKLKETSIFLFSIIIFILSSSALIFCIEKHVFYDLIPLQEIKKIKDFDLIKISEDKFLIKTKDQECELNLKNKIARCKR